MQYEKVQRALDEFDSLSMSEEKSFVMNLGQPMGLRLDDDTMVVLAVEPGGQAEAAGIQRGSRVLAVGGETVSVVEDAITALGRLRAEGSFEATVVYKEFDQKEDSVSHQIKGRSVYMWSYT
jgi:predicted metalloprotease with PDZ domain